MSEKPSGWEKDPDIAHEMAQVMDPFQVKAKKLLKPRIIRDRLFPKSREARLAVAEETIRAGEEDAEKTREWKAINKDLLSINRRWSHVSEVIRQEALHNAEVAAVLEHVCLEPVTAEMPYWAFTRLAIISPRINKLLDRYRDTFEPFLSDPNSLARRYGFLIFEMARDLKLLALMAEVAGQPHPLARNSEGITTLPNGIEIAVNTNYPNIDAEVLDPTLWEKRKYVDTSRVSIVTIKGQKYVLKEHRTKQYRANLSVDINKFHSSKQEFQIAKQLEDFGQAENDRVRVRFEMPIGCVTMPDGYQFVLYKYEPAFEYNGPSLREAIVRNPEEFKEEFTQVTELALRLDKAATLTTISEALRENEYVKYFFVEKDRKLKTDGKLSDLTFEDFVAAKDEFLYCIAYLELTRAQNRLGLESDDKNEHVYITRESPRVTLEVVGFDLELMVPYPELNPILAEERYIQSKRKLIGLVSSDSLSFSERRILLALAVREGVVALAELVGQKEI
ncbi:MAG: hypothetical protein EXS55_01065 [Candidatus Magasanikbacteria bacterium]|nr:hypothetical protein [Candidatus Magasanikbacteria bacterium]